MQYYELKPWTGVGKDANAYIDWTQFKEETVTKLIKGKKINEDEIKFSSIWLKNVSKRFPDLMGTGSSEYFITDKFKDLILSMESPENIHFIHGVFTRKPKEYWLMNLLNNVECFDWENSEYTIYDEARVGRKAINEIEKLAIKEEKVNGRNIFQIAEYPFSIYISQKLKDAMEEHGITGYALDRHIYEIITT